MSQALIQGQPNRRGSAARIPAHDIESLIGRRLCAFLGSAQEVRDALKLPADNTATQRTLITAAKTRSTQWAKAAPSELRAFLTSIILKIVLADGSTRIQLDKAKLRSALLDLDDQPSAERPTAEEDILTLSIDAQIRRNGGATRLIVPSNAPDETPAQPNLALIKALARAHRWYEQLTAGTPLTEIAKENGVNETYINHIVRLVFLAPDIVEAILEGKQPIGFTVDSISKLQFVSWHEQRKSLGLLLIPSSGRLKPIVQR